MAGLVPAIHVSQPRMRAVRAFGLMGVPGAAAWDGRIKSGHDDVRLSLITRPCMSGSALTSAALDERRRRILFRAWRRGVREMDLIMGRFADANLTTMSEAELAEFERLLDIPDPEIMAWVLGGEAPPREFLTPLFARLREAQNRPDEAP